MSSNVAPTYASIVDLKQQLLIATNQTVYDSELNDILQKTDIYINLRLQKFTSLPVQTEIANQLADIESQMAAARFKLRRATPATYADYNNIKETIEDQFEFFLEQNFKTTFQAVGSQSGDTVYNNGKPTARNIYDDGGGGLSY